MKIYEATRNFPQEERFGLISDIRRSANSIIANIAESHGRYYYLDKIRVLYIARGEIEEVSSHLAVATGLQYLSIAESTDFLQEYEGLQLGLNDFIASLLHQSTAIKKSSKKNNSQ
ncbi:four helix bundle protein [Patescibacteria group bacterium]|nr:four helix bundle protein [Patescibacteria group bacterium]